MSAAREVKETRHLARAEWLEMLRPYLERMSPGTRAALLSGNTSFTNGGVRYTTDPIEPVTGPTHFSTARVDSITDGARKDYIQ